MFGFYKRKSRIIPNEGDTYTYNNPRSPYHGMTGIVHWHNDGKSFMLDCGNAWLCCIRIW